LKRLPADSLRDRIDSCKLLAEARDVQEDAGEIFAEKFAKAVQAGEKLALSFFFA
jgi:hypothetical protein